MDCIPHLLARNFPAIFFKTFEIKKKFIISIIVCAHECAQIWIEPRDFTMPLKIKRVNYFFKSNFFPQRVEKIAKIRTSVAFFSEVFFLSIHCSCNAGERALRGDVPSGSGADTDIPTMMRRMTTIARRSTRLFTLSNPTGCGWMFMTTGWWVCCRHFFFFSSFLVGIFWNFLKQL